MCLRQKRQRVPPVGRAVVQLLALPQVVRRAEQQLAQQPLQAELRRLPGQLAA